MNQTITIRDNRTGKEIEVPIVEGTYGETAIDAAEVAALGVDAGRPLRLYDPGFRNTASCRSAITYVDGNAGILSYRGYAIEDLAGEVSFPEVALLLLKGRLPDRAESEDWEGSVHLHRKLPADLVRVIESFPRGSHAMGTLVSVVGAMSTLFDDIHDVGCEAARMRHIDRLVGMVSAAGAHIYCHNQGVPAIAPDPQRPFVEDVAHTLLGEIGGHPKIVRALDILFTLHADHEQNCSANVMRSIASGGADPYTALSGAIGALYGPAHGGANEAVLKMLETIGSVSGVSDYVEGAKRKEYRLMGVGHPVYRHYDPRAALIKQVAKEVFEVTGRNDLIDIAEEMERIVLEDDYFVSRGLNPNVDFYSGLIYQSLGLPLDMMTVLFAIPRTVGWLAQWNEMLADEDATITRPRQIYIGDRERTLS